MSTGKIEIRDATVVERVIKGNTFLSQKGYLRPDDTQVIEIEVSLPRELPRGYAAGMYEIAGKQFQVDNYGRLALRPYGVWLEPVARPAAAAGRAA